MKYQLKYNKDNKFTILKETDQIADILAFVNFQLAFREIKYCSVWMNGQVLD